MGRKTYSDLDDLLEDLNDNSFGDEDCGHLDEEDLDLLRVPTPPAKPPTPPPPKVKKPKAAEDQ